MDHTGGKVSKIVRSPFATMAILMAASAGFGMGISAPPLPSVAPEKATVRDPTGPAPWLVPTLPPLDPPRREREPKVKRRSKAERKQRRRKRAQRAKA
jgi:hypothetical protein